MIPGLLTNVLQTELCLFYDCMTRDLQKQSGKSRTNLVRNFRAAHILEDRKQSRVETGKDDILPADKPNL